MKGKRGNVLNVGLVVGFVLLMLVAVLGGLIIADSKDATTTRTRTLVDDKQVTITNGSTTNLNHLDVFTTGFNIHNATDGADVVPSTQYTLNGPSGLLTWGTTDAGWNSQTVNVSYNYSKFDETGVYNVTVSGEDSFANFSSLGGVLGITIVAVMLVGMLLALFAGSILIK